MTHAIKERIRVENSRTGVKETKVILECGHSYIMGEFHNCDCPNCPAGAL